jgi:hypothetical protein
MHVRADDERETKKENADIRILTTAALRTFWFI